MSPSRGSLTLSALLGALLLLPFAVAIQANLAGIVDWHKPLIGEPLLEPSPPRFVETSVGRRVVAITRSNVLAVLDAESGEIAWRHQFDDVDPVVRFFVQDDNLLLLSGPSGNKARLFHLGTGHAQWERPLLSASDAQQVNPVWLGAHASFTPDKQAVVVLSAGMRIAKLDLRSGAELWGMNAPGAGDTILFTQVLVAESVVHLLAVTHSLASPTLATLTLDLATSVPKEDFTQIPCIVAAPSDAFLAGSDIGGSVRVVWFDVGRVRAAYVGPSGLIGNTKDLMPGGGRYYESVLQTGTEQSGIILARVRGGEVHVLNVKEGGKRVTVWENSRDSDDKSPSVYSGAVTATGAVFARTFWSFAQEWTAIEAMSVSHNGDIVNSGYTFAFDTNSHGVVLASAITPMVHFTEVKDRSQFMPTLLLSTSAGSLQLVHSQGIGWTRDESLANIVAAQFVDLGEPEVEETRELLADEGFVDRTIRHLSELKSLPEFMIRFAARIVLSSSASAVSTTPLVPGKLHRDQFGLQKLLVVATARGRLAGIDSANGNIIWTRNLGVTNVNGSEVAVKDMWTVREVGEKGEAILAVLAAKGQGETVGYHINALTGEPRGDVDVRTGIPVGKELFGGEHEAAFLVPFENCGTQIKVLAVVDSDKQVHIFPSCKKVAGDLSAVADKFHFTTTTPSLAGHIITGYSLAPLSSVPGECSGITLPSRALWTKHVNEALVSISPVQFDNVASVGRATGDKGVLYKYLNPHLAVIASASASAKGKAGGKTHGRVEVLDTTTGRVVYAVEVPAVDGQVRAVMVENWVVFAWLERDGWRLGSTELYEDKNARGKAESPGATTLAEQKITSRSQTFFLPGGVGALAFSTSRFGITAKELIYTNSQGQVTSIPRRLLDPRRPLGKPTSADKEEMLIPYDTILPSEPKRVLSHKYPILGTKALVTSPTFVESTSLLFAHGLDLFVTRGVTPSGMFDILSDNFNKAQLVLTLALLSGGIAVARPAVGRKMLRMRWY